MTLNEFGLKLRHHFPVWQEVPGNNEQLALAVLAEDESLWDLISPTARRIKEISERIPSSQRWTEKGRLESVGQMVDINRREAESMLYMNTAINAAGEGVTVPAYEDMWKMAHQAKLQGEVTWEQRRQAIEASRLLSLEVHRILKSLKQDLYDLYAEEHAIEQGNDPAPVKAKKLALVAKHIERLEGDFNERGVRYLVQAASEQGLDGADTDTNSRRSDSKAPEEAPHQISIKGFRMGDGRGGDSH